MVNTVQEVSDGTEDFLRPGEKVVPVTKEQILTDEEQAHFIEAILEGSHKDTMTVLGHKVKVHTLDVDEELQLALVIKNWEQTQGYERAYKTALVAAAVDEIDGQVLFIPITDNDEDTRVAKKFEMFIKYRPIFVDAVYGLYGEFELESNKGLLERLGKSLG